MTDRIKLTAGFSTRPRKGNSLHIPMASWRIPFSRRILALLGCKRSRRERHSLAVDMQEVAEILAWVKQQPGGPGNDGPGNDTRVLVSQDGTDVYVSVFQYDQRWLSYLDGDAESIANAGFAYTHRYGPCNIQGK